jgi:hypothetical protein
MRNWRYTVETGVELRDAIRDEDAKVLRLLCEASSELLSKLNEEDRDNYDLDLLDIIEECEADFDYDDTEDYNDYVNYQLSRFYDVCDAVDAWVSI